MTVIARPHPRVVTRRPPAFLSWLLVWLSVPLAVTSLALLLWTLRYEERIYPGVVVGEVSVGGLSVAEARQALEQAYAVPAPLPVPVTYDGRVWVLDGAMLNRQYRLDEALRQAFAVGRRGSLLDQLRTQAMTALYGARIPLRSTYELGSARLWLNELATRLYRPLRQPRVRLAEYDVQYVPGTPGREVDVVATWQRLRAVLEETASAAGRVSAPPVPLVVRESGPRFLDLSALEEAVRRISHHPFRLDAGPLGTFALDPVTISALVTLRPVQTAAGAVEVRAEVDRDRLRAVLANLAAQVNVAPLDARLAYDPEADRFSVLSPSQEGWEVDVDAAVDTVAQALAQGQSAVELPVRVLHPAVPMDATPAQLGIREVVGEGTTYFRGSSAPRVRNIVRAAEAVRGVVIPPGAVFSFNEAAGAITAANGYEDSLIIWGDRTAVGIGGGVCQVSTTLFRAAFYAGLPIVERWNHGYIVSWYGEPGLDATVYSPTVDLKFRNTTDHYLLVQPVVDAGRGVITFQLWGTRPGWTVEVQEPVKEDVQPAPPPVYQEDPSLPKGTIRQVEWPKEGMTVRVRRVVRAGEQVVEDREFVSTYAPWRAVYLYGPGTEVPGLGEGEEPSASEAGQ